MSLDKNSKVLFLVTSAVNTLFGNNEIARFTETIGTINSINANFNNAEIWLLESSYKSISSYLINTLPKNVKIKSFSRDTNIGIFIKESVNYSYEYCKKNNVNIKFKDNLKLTFLKNRTESYVFKEILSNHDLSKYDRVFKLSGRYSLSPTFDISQHNTNKMIFYKSITSNQPQVKIDKVYPCFCWSVGKKLLNETKDLFIDLEKEIKEIFNNIGYIDIEHSLYKKLNKKNVKKVNKLIIFENKGENNYVYL